MSTVVAVAVDGLVVMAADSCTNVYERPIPVGAQKVIRLPAGDSEILLGLCGSGGLVSELLAILKVDGVPAGGRDPQPWAHAVAKAVTEIAREAGLTENGKMDSSLVLGWGGLVWTLTHCMAIPHADGRAAVGSGEGPAIGTLDALLDRREQVGMSVVEIAVEAVRVGIRRDRYSDGEVLVHVLPGSAAAGSDG